MSFETKEESVQEGAPIELYLFTCGVSEYRYTSAEVDVVIDSQVWTSAPIVRSELERSPERVRNNLTLTVQRNMAVADLFRVWPRTEVVAVTLMRYHRDDEETVVLWMGRVLGSGWTGATAKLQCEPVSTSARRVGLRRSYQKNCPYAQFGVACGLNKEDWRHTTTVIAVNGLDIEVASFGSNSDVGVFPYAGGWIEWEFEPGNFEFRPIKIVAYSSSVLTVSFPFQGMAPGAIISIFPGDDHSLDTCHNIFNNRDNFGGMPFIPFKNPFDGMPIY